MMNPQITRPEILGTYVAEHLPGSEIEETPGILNHRYECSTVIEFGTYRYYDIIIR